MLSFRLSLLLILCALTSYLVLDLIVEKKTASVTAVGYAAVPGWYDDDHAAAFAVFRAHCQAVRMRASELRSGLPPSTAFLETCAKAVAFSPKGDRDARMFFERFFTVYHVRDAEKPFLTSYYEPVLQGSREKTADFPIPVLRRPDDLIDLIDAPEHAPLKEKGFAAARITDGALSPYDDRAAIYAGSLDKRGLEIAYVASLTDLFIAQVQGSMRIALKDGSFLKLTYAGRNGHPYVSIGRLLIKDGEIAREDMSLEKLLSWLEDHPEAGRRLMEKNPSYIFFNILESDDPEQGPIGGAGVPLTAGRSLAIDNAIWPYGLPMWINAPDFDAPLASPFPRLVIAQDTGSAIKGIARGDYFWGTGPAAGLLAGQVSHALDLFVLWPKDDPPPYAP